MDLSFKEVILLMEMEQEDFQFMVVLLMIKVLQENIHVQDYYQWQIVEEIQIQVNFL